MRIIYKTLLVGLSALMPASALAQQRCKGPGCAPVPTQSAAVPVPARGSGGFHHRGMGTKHLPTVFVPVYGLPWGYPVGYSSTMTTASSGSPTDTLPGQEGYLDLFLRPQDAAVMVDGTQMGRMFSDGQRLALRAGAHTVEIYRPGYRGRTFQITLAPGQEYPLRVDLISPEPSVPMGGVVTPGPVGEGYARVSLAKENDPSSTINGSKVDAEPLSEKESGQGTLELTLARSGGRIFVDGEAKGDLKAGVPVVLTLDAGEHMVRIDRDSKRVTLTTVRIRNGQKTAQIVE